MWPAIGHPTDGLMLAASHSIGRNAYIDDEVAIYLADLLLKFYPARLAERYKVEPATLDGIALIEAIATPIRNAMDYQHVTTPDLRAAAVKAPLASPDRLIAGCATAALPSALRRKVTCAISS